MAQGHSTRRIDARWASASLTVSRMVNADAVAAYRDPITLGEVFAVADGIGDDIMAAAAARSAVHAAVRSPLSGDPIKAVLAAKQALPEGLADCVLVVAMPFADRTSTGYRIAWVGDCRAHLWDGKSLSTLTSDQTMARYLRARGVVPDPRWEHVVTNTVRTTEVNQIGWTQVRAPHGLLFTTDGVHKVLSEREMVQVLAGSGSVGERTSRLVAAAARRGSDNATATVIEEPVSWPPIKQDPTSAWPAAVPTGWGASPVAA